MTLFFERALTGETPHSTEFLFSHLQKQRKDVDIAGTSITSGIVLIVCIFSNHHMNEDLCSCSDVTQSSNKMEYLMIILDDFC